MNQYKPVNKDNPTQQHSSVQPEPYEVRKWISIRGTAIFILLATFGVLLWIRNAGAGSLIAPRTATVSTTSIPYQGRLSDSNSIPITGSYEMTFKLYSSVSGGSALWEEVWAGESSVQVNEGLFNVMLGSLYAIPQSVVTENTNLFLGISVGADGEMVPRVQLGSVPYAIQALSVADASISKAQLASDSLPSTYPYLVHMGRVGLNMLNYCNGYVPGDPSRQQDGTKCDDVRYGISAFTAGPTMYSPSGNGYIDAAANLPDNNGEPRWGSAYTYFLDNNQSSRAVTLPVYSCNDVALYISTGTAQPSLLGDSTSLVYQRFPGNSGSNVTSCSCDNVDPTINIPTGSFRLTFLTRGASCTSYLRVGERDENGLPMGNWISENNLGTDWSNLQHYFGE